MTYTGGQAGLEVALARPSRSARGPARAAPAAGLGCQLLLDGHAQAVS